MAARHTTVNLTAVCLEQVWFMIYLDNAATTMRKPDAVVRAVTAAMCAMGNAGRGAHDAALDAARVVFETRVRLASLFHAENPKQIVFTPNSTAALNIAIKGILRPDDHVITTQLEHNSVLRPLYEMEDQGAALTVLNSDPQGRLRISDFEAAIRPETRAIVCTHGSNLTGNLVDIGAVGDIARRRGVLLVVDASQTAGVFPIDVQAMHIDILCFTGHKSLLGPQGTGGLYVRPGVTVRPLLSGGSGVQTYSRTHPEQMPTALEAGTLNTHGLAGLCAALSYIEATGLDVIREKELSLMRHFHDLVRAIPGVTVYGDFSARLRCPIVSLNLDGLDSASVSDALYMNDDISTRPGAHCAPLMHQALGTTAQGAVRFSFSHFNTHEEVERAAAAVRQLSF